MSMELNELAVLICVSIVLLLMTIDGHNFAFFEG